MARILVAMSGGVDSSVAAALLLDAGHQVVGVTLRLWGGESDSGCCSISDVDDARRVADRLGIDHHVFNFGDEFDSYVVSSYVSDHALGRTPNPCIECNRHIKFDRLLNRSRILGFDQLATGHHARIVEKPDGSFRIARSADRAKDQSYVLHMIKSDQLKDLVFPIGNLTKTDVRKEATRLGLRVADKPDSQEVCFITSRDGRSDFLNRRIPLTPGQVVSASGEKLGEVDAVELVTIGQRRGINLSGGHGPRYVTEVNVPERTVTVGSSLDLLVDQTPLETVQWIGGRTDQEVLVQTSAHGKSEWATVQDCEVHWVKPHKRVATGQSVVFYQSDEVIGGGLAR